MRLETTSMGVGALGVGWGMWVVGSMSLLCRGKGKQKRMYFTLRRPALKVAICSPYTFYIRIEFTYKDKKISKNKQWFLTYRNNSVQ